MWLQLPESSTGLEPGGGESQFNLVLSIGLLCEGPEKVSSLLFTSPVLMPTAWIFCLLHQRGSLCGGYTSGHVSLLAMRHAGSWVSVSALTELPPLLATLTDAVSSD